MAKEKQGLEKVTIRTYAGDMEELATMFPKLGYNKVVRQLVRNFIKTVNEKTQRNVDTNLTLPPNVDQIIEAASHDTDS